MQPYWTQDGNEIYRGHVLKVLKNMADESVHMVCTSPPYWGLRDYGLPPIIWDDLGDCEHVWGTCFQNTKHPNRSDNMPNTKNINQQRTSLRSGKPIETQFCQLCSAWCGSYGLEPTPELYIKHTVEIFREIHRVLRNDGTLWLNLGSSYAASRSYQVSDNLYKSAGTQKNMANAKPPMGFKPKDLIPIPWMVAIALQADGWWLRSAMPWVKRSSMPESCTDRPASALEYVFLLTKSAKYYFDMEAIKKNYKQSSIDRADNSQVTTSNSNRPVAFKRSLGNGRNFKNTDLFFESLESPFGAIFASDELVGLDINLKGFPGAHFATFPPRLAEVAILAGTSEKGCCEKCGASYKRVVDVSYKNDTTKDGRPAKGNHRHNENMVMKFASGERTRRITKTTGWKPTCKCNAGKKPCIVLDPFGGAMTTAIVAHKHGRKFIMIELSEDYIKNIGIPRIKKHTRQRGLWN